MARLVRSVECGVPVIYKAPFDRTKARDLLKSPVFSTSGCLKHFGESQKFHGVPVVAVNTPVDANHEIVETGEPDEMVEAILAEYLPSLNFDAFRPAQEMMRSEYSRRLSRRARLCFAAQHSYNDANGGFAGSVSLSGCGECTVAQTSENLSSTASGMMPDKCRREDPYTGMTFIYDYTLCRTGPQPADKSKNLFLSIPNVTRGRWLEANPNDVSRKSSNWYLTCTAILLSDGYLFVDDGRQLGKTRFL